VCLDQYYLDWKNL